MTGFLAPAFRRAVGAVAGATLGALGAGAALGATEVASARAAAAVREAALFAPLALPLTCLFVPIALVLSQTRVTLVLDAAFATEARSRRVIAALVLLPPFAVLWLALAARLGQLFMAAFHHVGLAALAQAVALGGLTLLVGAAAFAAIAFASRALSPQPLRRRAPWYALSGFYLSLAILLGGTHLGDQQGHGGGPLGALGVLRRPELDLTPVYGLLGAAALGMLFAAIFGRHWIRATVGLVVAAALAAGALWETALRFDAVPNVASTLTRRAGIPRWSLLALRRLADRDRDGYAALFGGGDCDDHDPRRHPDARDVPGNGVDEDCSGRDATPQPIAPTERAMAVETALPAETPDMNLLLVTVDTMRWDLHYAGNRHELSPNLDRLASRAVVFDHAYSLSSYTGRSIGPLMAGRYPTECQRDSGHFVRYLPGNVLLAERLRARGFATMGVASHFYFEPWFGLPQGIDRWDLSPRPAAEEQESVSADERVADRAIAQLRGPAAAATRFFQWVHFFDPHKQYVPHPAFAAFGDTEHNRYDGEVAFTDQQIGRLLAALDALPFASRTVVVVTSDHGEGFGEHGMSWHGLELWDELVRVPLLVFVPGFAPRHIEQFRSQIDLVPTLLELLQLPAPEPGAPDALSGVSLLPELRGAPALPRPVYIELPEGGYNGLRRSVIADGWKLTQRDEGFELYHLRTDPGERVNLARREPDELAHMRELLAQIRGNLHEVPARP